MAKYKRQRTSNGDVFSLEKRSSIMARIKARGNFSTEQNIIRVFRASRIVGWRRHLPMFGRPDFAFPQSRVVVFVDGCFWHGCPSHGRTPTSNLAYWIPKLARNRARDRAVSRYHRARGWKVLRIWEHDAEREPLRCARRVAAALKS